MKTRLAKLAACSLVAWLGMASTAMADSAAANCEVRKDGDKWKGASGPCTFSQRQGNISLDLKNGDSYSLVPSGKEGQYRDQKGIKVVRTVSGNTQEFKWDGGKKIILTYTGAAATNYPASSAGGGGGGSASRNDEFPTVCGVIVGGQTYSYRCSATDIYSGNQKVRTILNYPDQTIELTWRSGNRVGLQFEGMVPQEARYGSGEGEINFAFEDKTYFYYADKGRASWELQHLRN